MSTTNVINALCLIALGLWFDLSRWPQGPVDRSDFGYQKNWKRENRPLTYHTEDYYAYGELCCIFIIPLRMQECMSLQFLE